MTLTEKTGHLAWCALVALALARQAQGERSPAQENLFLTRWLAAALKQRRFPRDVAQDNDPASWLDSLTVYCAMRIAASYYGPTNRYGTISLSGAVS